MAVNLKFTKYEYFKKMFHENMSTGLNVLRGDQNVDIIR